MGQRIPRPRAIECVRSNDPPLELIIYHPDMRADFLQLTSGVIWTALNIDYPGHSFSHLGIFWGECVKVAYLYPRLRNPHRGPKRTPPEPGSLKLIPHHLKEHWRCASALV